VDEGGRQNWILAPSGGFSMLDAEMVKALRAVPSALLVPAAVLAARQVRQRRTVPHENAARQWFSARREFFSRTFAPVSLVFVTLALVNCPLHGQPGSSAQPARQGSAIETRNDTPEPTDKNSSGPQEVGLLSKFEFWLSIVIALFGAFVLVLEYRLLSRTRATATEILRIYGVTLILVGSLFLITAGFSSNQISPVSGLFGTVAGYLLGKTSNREGQPRTETGRRQTGVSHEPTSSDETR
jgi:hypothetical protein